MMDDHFDARMDQMIKNDLTSIKTEPICDPQYQYIDGEPPNETEPGTMDNHCDARMDQMIKNDLTSIKKPEPICDPRYHQHVHTNHSETSLETKPETIDTAVCVADNASPVPGYIDKSEDVEHDDCSILMSVKEEYYDIECNELEIKQEPVNVAQDDNATCFIMTIKPDRTTHISNSNAGSRCDKCFDHDSCIRKDMMFHTGEKTFSCDQCDKSFKQMNYLRKHLMTHTGEKTFSCYLCDKRFAASNNLKKHMMIHSGERSYSCDQCDKSFNQKSILKTHMRTHTGEKTFSCALCDKK